MGRATRYSWSHSRSSALAECPRRAFYEYYVEGEPEDSAVWRLKELTQLPMWAGSVVDFIISRALGEIRSKGTARTGLAEYGSRHYWRGIKRSRGIVESIRQRARTRDERNAEPFRPLQHDYYGFDVGEEYLATMDNRVRTCLENFEHSETYERMRAAGVQNWGSVVKLDEDVAPSFTLQGQKIYAAYDFWFRDQDELHILDWKTGSEGYGSASAERQLSVYALYGIYELRQPLDRIYTQAVWLQGTADWNPERPTRDDLRKVRDGILAEIAAEHELLDVRHFKTRSEYHASREAFPPKPSVRACLNCKFREVCAEGCSACSHVRSGGPC